MRGLEVAQYVDLYGPVGISDLARHFNVDKGSISRLVKVAEVDGWLMRTPAGVVLGPRAALLGDTSPVARAAEESRSLLEALTGATGLVTQALALAGNRAIGLATAGPSGPAETYFRRPRFPLWTSAGGKVIASQLSPALLDPLLPAEPYPLAETLMPEWTDPTIRGDLLDPSGSSARRESPTRVLDRAALDAQLAGIRSAGMFREYGEMHDEIGCIAVPWPHHGVPAAIVCVGTLEEVEAGHVLIERALRAAARHSATRDDVTIAAAAALTG
jgi:DNA-binding IclR family transcriptional regulator